MQTICSDYLKVLISVFCNFCGKVLCGHGLDSQYPDHRHGLMLVTLGSLAPSSHTLHGLPQQQGKETAFD